AFHQPRHQHDLAAGEFQRIVVHVALVLVDLPKAGDTRRDGAAAVAEQIIELDVADEGELGARQQADRHVRLVRRCEAARDRVAETGGYELLPDLGRTGRNMLETVIAHGDLLTPDNPEGRYSDRSGIVTYGHLNT